MHRLDSGPPKLRAVCVHDKLGLVQAYSKAKACSLSSGGLDQDSQIGDVCK